MADGHPLLEGFVPLDRIKTKHGDSLLVPLGLMQGQDKAPEPLRPPQHNVPNKKDTAPVPAGPYDLGSVNAQSPTVVQDMQALASRILTKSKLASLDGFHAELCKEMFVAVSLRILCTPEWPTEWAEVLKFLVDPDWDSPNQIISDLLNARYDFPYTYASANTSLLADMPADSLAILLRRFHGIWTKAIQATAVKAGRAAVKRTRKPAGVQVFSPGELGRALDGIAKMDEKVRQQAEQHLRAATTNDGFRTLPNVRKAAQNLDRVAVDFENLSEPIKHLQVELALAGAMAANDFRVSPILLLGEPGIGKTYLAMQLAKALGVPMDTMSAGAAQGGFQLTGSHPTWARSMPGSVFTLLSTGRSAAPVMVVDEVDKIGDAQQYPIQPTLLDLLEGNTAKTFKDEFFDLKIDASRIIFVLTANEVDRVPAPLLSRVSVFNVPRPAPVQRLRVIQDELGRLCRKTRKDIEFDGSVNELSDRVDIDLRQTIRLVQEGFGQAMMVGACTARVVLPASRGMRSIGFLPSA